jgi:hypothetical protein
MTRPQLEVIFCDDVRQEIGNKQSFIGVYSGDLLVERLPVVLPRLCVVASLTLPQGDECDSVHFQIMQGEQCLLKTHDFPGSSEAIFADQDTRIAVIAVMSPFQIDEETSLYVVALYDEAELHSRHLRIRLASDRLVES